MRNLSLWAPLLDLTGTVVQDVYLDDKSQLVIRVRAGHKQRNRCGQCGRRCPRYDQGEGDRRWRLLDLASTMAFLEAPGVRVRCPRHGVVVARVPWADHDVRFTRSFDDQVAWLAAHADQTTVSTLMRIAWRSVGRALARVVKRTGRGIDPLHGLRRVGIDEISHGHGQRYLITVTDHDSGRLVWAASGRDAKTLRRFFDELGEARAHQLTHVSCDGADWIIPVLGERCPQAIVCLDTFHVAMWATRALDEVRRAVWNEARRRGDTGHADSLKNLRWALWKKPQDLSARQRGQLAWVQRTNKDLYRAYLLKEQLRLLLHRPYQEALALLEAWLEEALYGRLEPFEKLAHTLVKYLEPLTATLQHRLTNARVESLHTRIRLVIRRGYGFHSPEAVIALAKLCFGGLCPPLPARAA